MTPVDVLTPKRIGKVYFPLAWSWIFMGAEAPICTSILQQSPGPLLGSAAFLVLMSLAYWIESPVLDLLSTSTTLLTNFASSQVLLRFGNIMIVLVTVVHALVALPPIYDWAMLSVIRVPATVAVAAHVPFIIMIPWSGCVGWRRSLQGFAIRAQQTKAIGVGTIVRVSTITLVGGGLAASHQMSGLVAVAFGLVAGVFAEALFIQFATRRLLAHFFGKDDGRGSPVTLGKVTKFHIPLLLSTMLMLTGNLVVAGALSRSQLPLISLAAWQVSSAVVWMFRTTTFALPEMVISFFQESLAKPLLRYCLTIGAILSISLLLFGLTGLDKLVFTSLLRADFETARLASLGLLACFAIPFLNAFASYVRAVLTFRHQTNARLWAIGVGILSLFVCLQIFVSARMPGIILAPLALTISQLFELAVLVGFLGGLTGRPIAARASSG